MRVIFTTKEKANIGKYLTKQGKSIQKNLPLTPEGNVDTEKLPRVHAYKQTIKGLKEMGVMDSNILLDNGFISAGLLFRF